MVGITAAVVTHVGKVELKNLPEQYPGVPLRYLDVFSPKHISVIGSLDELEPTTSMSLDVITLKCHRMKGLNSALFAYWPEGWTDDWGVEELLRWEGRENEIRRDKYYADFIYEGDFNSQSSPRALGSPASAIESKGSNRNHPTSPKPNTGSTVVVRELRGTVRERDMGIRSDRPKLLES